MSAGRMRFDGNTRITLKKVEWEAADSFTYEFWVKAEHEIEMDVESGEGESGIQGKRYVIAPVYVAPDDAGVGIAVGVNGIAVYEHSRNYIPAVLVHDHDFSHWTHVALVYHHKQPHLYLNGVLVRQGVVSPCRHVYPCADLGGHEYGYFIGEMQEFRLWSTTRSNDQIVDMMNQDAAGNEPNLLWLWNHSTRKMTWNGAQGEVQISVIMASNNRFPLNFFALKALEMQKFPHSQMEVIFVADGPPDTGADFQELVQPTYPLKYVQCKSSLGRARARNLGVQMASGQILLFLDAEMICPPNFVQGHVIHHLTQPNLVVSAGMDMRRVITVLAPGFNSEQVTQLYSIYANEPHVLKMIDDFYIHVGNPIQLLPTEKILDVDYLSQHSYQYDYFREILLEYGNRLSGFRFPWMNFITNNVSLPRALMDAVGGFDEAFQGFGWEDWELGYRLFHQGAAFIHDERLRNFHQEHPILSANMAESRRNFLRFQQKHAGVDIRMFILDMIPMRQTFQEINQYLNEFDALCERYPYRCSALKKFIMDILEHMAVLFANSQPISNVVESAHLLPWDLEQVQVELSELRKGGEFPHLQALVQLLLQM